MSQPKRLTKQRFDALRTVVERGFFEWRTQLEDDYDIAFNEDGTFDINELEELREPGADLEIAMLVDQLDEMAQAVAAWSILNRRYGQ